MIRGIVALGESLVIGFRALAISAHYAAVDDGEATGEAPTAELTRGQLIFAFAVAIGFTVIALQGVAGADHRLHRDRLDRLGSCSSRARSGSGC